MTQRKTQTAAYWQDQFKVGSEDTEYIYNYILDTNKPYTLDQLANVLVRRRCEAEELAARTELQRGKLYQPQDSYAVNDQVVFAKFNFALGQVRSTRPGHHPDYGAFTVLEVALENSTETREFVADFPQPELLNVGDAQSLANLQGLLTPEELFEAYKDSIRAKVKAALEASDDFVEFHDQYFLADLLVEFHEGLFNIADAAIDINQGPLPIDALIEQMSLVDGSEITEVLRFSVSYRLANDDRFDDVGPTGQVLWYLKRLEPPEAHQRPPRLAISELPDYDPAEFEDELLAILADIDDEYSYPEDIPATPANAKAVTIVLNYPHWRAGTLPLTPKTQPFFPTSTYNPVRFEFVDGHTGDVFPGWSMLNGHYICGLDKWYQKHKLPVGAYLELKRTNDPMRLIIDYQPTRAQRDWVRVATVVNHQLAFRMNTQAINCKYDELMIIGDPNPTQTDRLWQNAEEKGVSLYELLIQVFPELSKLNPQSTVHVKTLYSAVNVIRRFAPGSVIQELGLHACFVPMHHGYYTFDPSLQD